MKNIKNIKYIILVVLVLVLIYILLKYKEKFITLADFNSKHAEFKEHNIKCQELITLLDEITDNIEANNIPELINHLIDNGGTLGATISDNINTVYTSKKPEFSDSDFADIFKADDFTSKNKVLQDSLTSLDKQIEIIKKQLEGPGPIESIAVTGDSPIGYEKSNTFNVTSKTGDGAKITLTQVDNKWVAAVWAEGSKYIMGEKLTLLETSVGQEGQSSYEDNSGLTFTVNTLTNLELNTIDITNYKYAIDSFKSALDIFKDTELNIDKLVGDEKADTAATAGHITVDLTTNYKVDPFSKNLNKIDRHLLWSNYTIEHDLEVPNATGEDQYDMAYDNISEKGEVKYLKAERSETEEVLTATFLQNGNTYLPNTLANNSIILIGSIVLTFTGTDEPVKKEPQTPLKIDTIDQSNVKNVNYEIKDIKDDLTRKIIIFKKNKYINIKDKGFTNANLNNFDIEFNFSGLYTTNITAAHMNYILINPETGIKPSEIIYDLINANYNILNYKTRILVNYLKCRNSDTWNKNTQVCDLMDDGFIPSDLDSRLYGALKAPFVPLKGGKDTTMKDSMDKYQNIIKAIMEQLKTANAGDGKTLTPADAVVIYELLDGDKSDKAYTVNDIKEALGLNENNN